MSPFQFFVYVFALRSPKLFLVFMAFLAFSLWHAFSGSGLRPNMAYYDGQWVGARTLKWNAPGHRCTGAGPVTITIKNRYFLFPVVEGRDPNSRPQYLSPGAGGYSFSVFGDHTFETRVSNSTFIATDIGPQCSWWVRATRAGSAKASTTKPKSNATTDDNI